MYLVAVYFRNEFKSFISEINYKRSYWQDVGAPKIFKTYKSAKRCRDQVDEWATLAELKVVELKEVKHE